MSKPKQSNSHESITALGSVVPQARSFFPEATMKDDTRKSISGRRNFLLALGAGGTATAAAVIAKGTKTVAPAPDAGKRKAGGYQLSEHVRTYYRTAKI